jgi:hypothetical protein
MAPLEDSRMVFVVSSVGDANDQINRDIATVNHLMNEFPGNVFLCRGTFLLIDLSQPRPIEQWRDFYIALLNRCDALYVSDDDRRHYLADWALENEMTILGDHMDLELFMATPLMGVSE